MSLFDNDNHEDGIEIIAKQDGEDGEVETQKVDDVDKSAPSLDALEKALSDAGVDSAGVKKIMSALSETSKAAKKDGEEGDGESDEEKKTKAKGGKAKGVHEDDEEENDKPRFGNPRKTEKADDTIFKMMADGSLVVSGEVTKSRRMTAGRVNKIMQLFGSTAALLKEADPEVFEKALEALTKGDLPKDPGFPSKVRPTEAPMAKGIDADAVEAIITKAMAPVNEKLEAIEKTRGGSASLEDDGGTETKVEKSGGIWNGLLH